ncbi:hypothetical protein FB45DRAFT_928659 [Roridomyces roridus]|uniref:NAD(P)-binding protein n=1 Tax=Roridomyces roridus TaxID=1738132 RepID=A0AAD7FHV2_9AGAR|nr:hypothetical protein FB45DRAFT_928659 [Roridomyces roridus]
MASPSRVWFITGSSSGLGRNLLETVLAAGERAVATLRKPEVLKELQAKYPADQLLVTRLDVTKPDEVVAAFNAAKEHFGLVSVVVNNAGFGLLSEIEGTPEKDAREQFDVNFWGSVYVTKEAIRFFREDNPNGAGGRFINISTVGGYSANQCLAFYSAAKFAIEGFTESAIKEVLPEWNIQGCIIEPGGFDTEWRGGSMTILPSHPAYASPTSPSSQVRTMLETIPFNGDVSKASKTIMQVASLPKMPLRLPLNTEAYCLVKMKANMTLAQLEEFAELSHSTNKDGIEREKVMEILGMVNH